MTAQPATRQLSPMAAILAWVWPGLGHISLGHRRRGVLIMAGVLFMYLCGLLIGGIDVVDGRRDRLWFVAQALCGPITFATDFVNQRFVPRLPDNWQRDAEWRQRYQERDPEVLRQLRGPSLGHVNEMGTLFVALAGLMNLVVILDALGGRPDLESGG